MLSLRGYEIYYFTTKETRESKQLFFTCVGLKTYPPNRPQVRAVLPPLEVLLLVLLLGLLQQTGTICLKITDTFFAAAATFSPLV